MLVQADPKPMTPKQVAKTLRENPDMKMVLGDPKPKTIRLKGSAYTKFRRQVFLHYGGRCQGCGSYFPLYIKINGKQYFDLYECGHVSHKKSRGAGGEDTIKNVLWHCIGCHIDWENHTGVYRDRQKEGENDSGR